MPYLELSPYTHIPLHNPLVYELSFYISREAC